MHKKISGNTAKKIVESPGDSNHIWGIVSGIDWDNDDKVMDFTEYVSYKQDDFLVEYGYPIALMPVPVDAFP
ncbi:MAG: hypothetical protein OMM_13047 [Candidatus Magnetoglobus multicellularis str. Araruama]|uniref:Uncharacterized protein n=1 Tax=Candidatus Magnetoglobus multicellularis str. Araruama TaxID=890399 RepID=A0A1V1NUI1_9BACT|nr:MAG: hypothetical protein OMM_13047 [Candidatus Magnetoglobus multicellularis str. Araruama]